jgi:hypothetical protein
MFHHPAASTRADAVVTDYRGLSVVLHGVDGGEPGPGNALASLLEPGLDAVWAFFCADIAVGAEVSEACVYEEIDFFFG